MTGTETAPGSNGTAAPDRLASALRASMSDAATLRQENRALRARLGEPIAIIGTGCRFPGGADDADRLWDLVASGGDAVTPFPVDRGWDLDALTAGTDVDPASLRGAFLPGALRFDPDVFGISPREALAMDPQQRLLLETAWESVETARLDVTTLAGTRVGVFVGASHSGYLPDWRATPPEARGYAMTGNTSSVVSGRIAYALGLEGPAVTIDTACSSSLVALHMAAQALRAGEVDLALAGGVTVMATPLVFKEFIEQGGFAGDGRCKAFSADADGAGFAEGAGLVLLERLSDAQRHDRPVLAVVRGSAINQDGASSGLTAPNGPSQERVVRAALASAGLTPADVDAVEAHGTGTRLGDPIEAHALLATYGHDRPTVDGTAQPLWIGSVKSNIGHTQAASGIAGVLKMVGALRRGVLPPTLHADVPSDQIDWGTGAVQLLTDTRAWPRTGRPRRAAVSSFGISGTNAHVVLEQAPESAAAGVPGGTDAPADPAPVPVPISAPDGDGLRGYAVRLARHLRDDPGATPGDVAFSLATTRAQLDTRAVVVTADREELVAGLDAVAAGRPHPAVVTGDGTRARRIAFLFPGQGAQRAAMARDLHTRVPAFARHLDAVLDALEPHLERSLREILFADEGAPGSELLHRTAYTQPALFAVSVALFRLLEDQGVHPDLLLGHSIGELAAAHVAGVLDLPSAARLVALRGRLMEALPDGGAMASLQGPLPEITEVAAGPGLALAAVNGPASAVVSGDEDAVVAVVERWKAAGRKATRLRVSHAFHSHHLDPVLHRFRAAVAETALHRPRIPVVSNVTGAVLTAEQARSADYWTDHVRGTVRFADGVATAADRGCDVFVELGPGGALLGMVDDQLGDRAAGVPLLRRNRDEPSSLALALGELAVRRVPLDRRAVFASGGARVVDLPTYPFRHRTFWLDPAPPLGTGRSTGGGSGDELLWAAVREGDAAGVAALLGSTDDVDTEDTDDIDTVDAVTRLLPRLAGWRAGEDAAARIDGLVHEVAWVPLALGSTAPATGRWLVLRDPSAAGAWVDELTRLGIEVVEPADVPPDRDGAAAAIAAVVDAAPVDGVLSLLGADPEPADPEPADPEPAGPEPAGPEPAAPDAAGPGRRFAGEVAALQAALERTGGPVWCATVGGAGDEGVTSPSAALRFGLARVAAAEHPDRWGGVLDLPVAPTPATADALRFVLGGRTGEQEVLVRPQGALARRLDLVSARPAREQRVITGTVLVTGGTGALGCAVAGHYARAGARHLVLASRGGRATDRTRRLAESLADTGTRVEVVRCDVADRAEVAAMLDALSGPPLQAVVHTAGIVADGVLDGVSAADLDAVLRPKLDGALHLHELTAGHPLEEFVLFSSAAGTLGGPGQTAYAAANAALDALARARHTAGLPALSVAWGAWAGEGMAAAVTTRVEAGGITPLPPETALHGLDRARRGTRPAVLLADMDVAALAAAAPGPARALFDLLAGAAAVQPAGTTPEDARDRLAALPPDRLQAALEDLVAERVALVLGHADVGAVPLDRPFKELGFDSLTAVELRNHINAATGAGIPAATVFDHPTCRALAGHLAAEHFGAGGPSRADVEDRIEELAGLLPALDEVDRAALATRMARVATEAGARRNGPQVPPQAGPAEAMAGRLGEASDDELFAYIRSEFGKR